MAVVSHCNFLQFFAQESQHEWFYTKRAMFTVGLRWSNSSMAVPELPKTSFVGVWTLNAKLIRFCCDDEWIESRHHDEQMNDDRGNKDVLRPERSHPRGFDCFAIPTHTCNESRTWNCSNSLGTKIVPTAKSSWSDHWLPSLAVRKISLTPVKISSWFQPLNYVSTGISLDCMPIITESKLNLSPDTSPCSVWPFEMLKGILNDREFKSNDEIEEAIALGWNDPRLMRCRASCATGWVVLHGSLRMVDSILFHK
jgi:hypothetical protein